MHNIIVQHRQCRCWVHVHAIHAASNVHHEKIVAWISFSMHACGFILLVMVLSMAALWATRAPLL